VEEEEEEEEEELSGGELVMRNFRELLWYWKEYYLRRGRDRLSIEFSSHIPFHYWLQIVGKLEYDILLVSCYTNCFILCCNQFV